jgi:hypothetical protein
MKRGGVLPGRQERGGRPGPEPGPPLPGLVPVRHPRHARPGSGARHPTSSLGPPSHGAGVSVSVRVAGWLRPAPRSDAALRGRGCAAMGACWVHGAAHCDGERSPGRACPAGHRVPGPDLPERVRADPAVQRPGGGAHDAAPGQADPVPGADGAHRDEVPPQRGVVRVVERDPVGAGRISRRRLPPGGPAWPRSASSRSSRAD